MAELIGAVANRHRLKALLFLYQIGRTYVIDIADEFELSQGTTSNQLQILYRCGLLKREREGNLVFYSLTERGKRLAEFLVRKFLPAGRRRGG